MSVVPTEDELTERALLDRSRSRMGMVADCIGAVMTSVHEGHWEYAQAEARLAWDFYMLALGLFCTSEASQ